ncbi:unnamed protein product [Caretta caretta]
MTPLIIVTLNTRGCRMALRRSQVLSYLREGGYSVVFLQETHTDPTAEDRWRLEWGDGVYFSHCTAWQAGVATLFSPTLRPEVLGVTEAVPGHLLHLRVRLEGLVVNFVNIYAPQVSSQRPQFYQQVSEFLDTLDSHECLILGGDFNTTLEERDRSGAEPSPAAATILRDIVDYHSLVDVWRDHHPDDTSTFTFVRVEARRSHRSRLDRIYLSRLHLSQAHSSTIRPAPFSDHHLVAVTVSLRAEGPGPAYWHFNNSLLEDESFVMSFREFWLAWREQWRAFPSVRRWWDLGKVRAKLFCRNYTRGTSRRRNAAIEQLEREVLELERRLAASPGDPSLCGACREKREELRALEDHRARGAFVRSRIRLLREMDRGSRFFYALEKTRGAKKHVTCLLAEDGTPLTDPEEMCGRARDFYANLFSPDPTDPGACGVLWEELPTVSVGDRDRLELSLTLAEFSEALRRMPTNKSPGMDGLTVEFYRAFWDILGPDLVAVWAESLQGGVLPLSCRRAVLALLPKKGDLRDLRNWRPLSLLSTDYKIVAKAISLRLGPVMADVIHPDQTYTVPGRSIFDNLFLVRDLLELGRRDGLSFALLSLDQEKAFDRVDHGYLLSTLRAFGFGPQFVSFLRVLYASAECLVRLNWTLTEPVSFGRGVRQGCPLSGQLYALAIEPFLCLLRRRLTGLVLREPELRLVLSAYADDVLLVVQDPGDLVRVEACQTIFSAASSARVNWVKSSGLAVGGWRQVSSLPPALQTIRWSAGPLLYLGVYLSATHPSPPENWQNLEGGVIERIRKWTRLLRCLSLRGRALVLNQLVLSTLWYRLNTLAPAPGFLSHLRRLILEFFWSGLHWAPVGVLHLPLKEGGQGLKCLYTQVRVFRLQALQRLLYSAGSLTWSILAHAFLRRFHGLRYDRQLFYLCPRGFPRDLSGLPDFYQDLLRAWKLFSTTRSVAAIVGADLLTEPLLHNPQLCVQAAESRTVRQRLVLAGVTRVGDLLDYDRGDWLDPLTLARRMGLSSLRTPRRVLQEVEAALTPAARAYVSRALREGTPRPSLTPGPPDLFIGPLPCRSQHTPHPFTASRLHELQPVGFQVASRQYLYTLTLHTLHARTLVSRPDTKWRDLLPPLEGEQPRWASLYSTLVPRPVGDISWRLLHGAVSTGVFLTRFTSLPETCPFCNVRETLAHVYLECARLQPFFRLLTNILLRFWLHFSPHLFIYTLPIRGPTKSRDLLVNLLLALAKTAIYKTRERRLAHEASCDCEAVFRLSVHSRIRAEFLWAASTDSLDTFEERWALSGVLCSVTPSGSLRLTL